MPMIPESVVQEILQRSNIVEVINSFVPLKNSGNGNWKACCPFHQEKTPSFSVSETKQLFYCFGCQKGGNVVTFLRDYLNIDYVDALRNLAERYNVVIPSNVSPEEEQAYRARRSLESRLYDLHRELAQFYMNNLRQNNDSPVAQYFATRNIPMDYADKFQIGAAPDSWDAGINHLKRIGFTEDEIIASGVAVSKEGSNRIYDRFRNRLIFSITDEVNRVIGFSARLIVKDDQAPKYVNSPESPIFHKGEILYGLAQAKDAIRAKKFAIVCEGQLDTIAMHRAGLENTVAPQGLAFRPEQASILKRYTDKIYLAFDTDSAGLQGTLRVLEFLLPMGFEIKALSIAGGKDPDEILKTQGPEVLHKAVEDALPLTDIIHRGLARNLDLTTPNGRAQAADQAIALLNNVPNHILREMYLDEIAAKLRIPFDQIFKRARELKKTAPATFSPAAEQTPPAQPAQAEYVDMRSEIIRHAESSLLLLALNSADGPRQIAEVLDYKLLSDAPAAKVLQELIELSYNGEWFNGSELLDHLPDELSANPNVIKLLMRDETLSPGQCAQILNDCPLVLKTEFNKKRRQELLIELRETSDTVRQAELLQELKELR